MSDPNDDPPANLPALLPPPLPPADPNGDLAMARIWRMLVEEAEQKRDKFAAEIARRTWGMRRRTVRIDLPPITDAASVAAAQAKVIADVAGEDLTPREGRDVSTIIEYRRRAIEMLEVEPTLRALLEARAEARKKAGRGR